MTGNHINHANDFLVRWYAQYMMLVEQQGFGQAAGSWDREALMKAPTYTYAPGGVLTRTAAGVDNRLRFAIPVYGSGFVPESELTEQI
ncbi:hypothetical protein [Paenibacillus sp. GCM10027626]|uniref:hypothetical protein n=1 Tax=Paenibacillus sp. GCM10027626 TaxID=3273411 RepID=UPI0036390281